MSAAAMIFVGCWAALVVALVGVFFELTGRWPWEDES